MVPSNRHHSSPVVWQQRLDSAHSEAEVIVVVQNFIEGLGRETLARLPAELQPGRFQSAAEVSSYAFSVVLHRLKGASDVAETIQSMASFFMSAATRMTQICTMSPAAGPSPGSD